jgi:hypothetical protein
MLALGIHTPYNQQLKVFVDGNSEREFYTFIRPSKALSQIHARKLDSVAEMVRELHQRTAGIRFLPEGL